ncbi:unnamed protein product [Candidula unifasciata]|uniref:LITAF domain-containing protein n=1 Tax=Candidula unifasciata TaxID=100452 RepID=A0A8S3YHS4_9EUPU|nr:unnamed protein product [Candidula unifasciata]
MEAGPPKPYDPPPEYQPPQVASPYVSYNTGPVQTYPPQAGAQPPYAQTSKSLNTVIIQQPQSLAISSVVYRYSQYPALVVCQHCQATVTTMVSYETGLLTWAVAGAICMFGLWLGCCLIPFCINATKDVEHRCPNCKNVVGKFRHFG